MGITVGSCEGCGLGWLESSSEGATVGVGVGGTVGVTVGQLDGTKLGWLKGSSDGAALGVAVGVTVGLCEGTGLGCVEG